MTGALLAPILALLLAINPGVLAERAGHWPDWRLPAPLARPTGLTGQRDLIYPEWMAGHWQLRSDDLAVEVRFCRDSNGAVVGDRAGNATAIGRALLGKALLKVANDPANPNRQIAVMAGDQQLESTVVGRRSEIPDGEHFWADELALQVLHGPGDPRVSRVETLSHYSRNQNGTVSAEQWQATYSSPAMGLASAAINSSHYDLELTPISPSADLSPAQPQPQSDPAS